MEDFNNTYEIDRIKTLNEIYAEENERIKHEYRILHDKYDESIREIDRLKQEYNSLYTKFTIKDEEVKRYKKMIGNRIRSFIGRCLRKIKHIFSKKG